MRKPQNQRNHCGWSGTLKSGVDPIHTVHTSPAPMPERKATYQPPRPLPSVTAPTLWEKAVKWFGDRGIPESVMAEKGITASEEFCPVCY